MEIVGEVFVKDTDEWVRLIHNKIQGRTCFEVGREHEKGVICWNHTKGMFDTVTVSLSRCGLAA